MQPLFEHGMEFAGFNTHVELLEDVGHCPQLEATGRLLELRLPFPAAVPA